jgi:hypothetical protein
MMNQPLAILTIADRRPAIEPFPVTEIAGHLRD